MKYELFYLVGEKNESQLDAIRAEVVEILKAENATLAEEEAVEKRKLAYEIKHQSRGTYITRRFDLPEIDFWADEANAEKEFGIKAIINKLNLHSQILRAMIVKTSDLPEPGTKEARKAREMKEQKEQRGNIQKERPARAEKPNAFKKIERKAPVKPTETKKVEETKEVNKEESAIDKKLEEILNI